MYIDLEKFRLKIQSNIEIVENYINSIIQRDSIDLNQLNRDLFCQFDVGFVFNNVLLENNISLETIKYIDDLSENQGLNSYFQLVTKPSDITSYLSSGDPIKMDIGFIFLKGKLTNCDKMFILETAEKEKLLKIFSDSLNEINDSKKTYIEEMNKIKEKNNEWYNENELKCNNLLKTFESNDNNMKQQISERLDTLEETYKEKLMVSAPANHIQKETEKYRKEVGKYQLAIILINVVIVCLLLFVIWPSISIDKTIVTINFFSNEFLLQSSFIVFAILSLLFYFLRIYVKLFLGAKNIYNEYKQKYSLTYFYLALKKDGSICNNELANQILASLFTTADSGLVKSEVSSSEVEKLMLSLMASLNNKN